MRQAAREEWWNVSHVYVLDIFMLVVKFLFIEFRGGGGQRVAVSLVLDLVHFVACS